MTSNQNTFLSLSRDYLNRLQNSFNQEILESVSLLAQDLYEAWVEQRNVFICGNGGSAANAIHIANDFHFGIGACGPGPSLPGLRIEALSANQGVITCLANDIGYENIYSHQLQVKGRPEDILIVLSGSGNSPNIANALDTAARMNIKSFAILAYSGGLCLEKADVPLHFPVNDMQVAEDTQLLVGHMCMQWLNSNKPSSLSTLF
ncbi:SIS domain-containing protein [Synechococcus sp. MIT S9451]|uniref:SIS domain-containing protein n=1 Tax=Synechococcus sp. MIT S9451 TaxID=3082543 RepID=UPI0039B46866